MAPRISIFSIVVDAEYLSYVKSIETHVRAFLQLNISAVGSVCSAEFLNFLKKVQFRLLKASCLELAFKFQKSNIKLIRLTKTILGQDWQICFGQKTEPPQECSGLK